MKAITLRVGGMSCDGCVRNVTGVLKAITGVTHVDVNLDPGEAAVTFDSNQTNEAALRQAIEDAGFDVH